MRERWRYQSNHDYMHDFPACYNGCSGRAQFPLHGTPGNKQRPLLRL